MNKQEQVILLAKFTLLLIQLNHLKPEHKAAQSWKNLQLPHLQHDARNPHNTSTTRYSLQNFFIRQMNEK